MRHLALFHDLTGTVDDTELMVGVTPVDADEHPVRRNRFDR